MPEDNFEYASEYEQRQQTKLLVEMRDILYDIRQALWKTTERRFWRDPEPTWSDDDPFKAGGTD